MAKRDLLKEADLRSRLERLDAEQGEAGAAVAIAHAAYQPFAHAFAAADTRLRTLWEDRWAGVEVGKPEMLAAYDARTVASGNRGPHKKRLEEAAGWLDRVRRELAIITKELGT